MDGFGIYRTDYSVIPNSITQNIPINMIQVPAGRNLKVADYVIDGQSRLYYINKISGNLAKVTFMHNLKGASGTTLFSGSEVTGDGYMSSQFINGKQVIEGDIYINTETHDLYQCNMVQADMAYWGHLMNLNGAQGENGTKIYYSSEKPASNLTASAISVTSLIPSPGTLNETIGQFVICANGNYFRITGVGGMFLDIQFLTNFSGATGSNSGFYFSDAISLVNDVAISQIFPSGFKIGDHIISSTGKIYRISGIYGTRVQLTYISSFIGETPVEFQVLDLTNNENYYLDLTPYRKVEIDSYDLAHVKDIDNQYIAQGAIHAKLYMDSMGYLKRGFYVEGVNFQTKSFYKNTSRVIICPAGTNATVYLTKFKRLY